MSYLHRVAAKLQTIRAENRYRELPTQSLGDVIDFGSNDYLGLSTDPQVVQALARATRVGSGGARLLSGRSREHALLEDELAEWLGRERALLFSSGYHAAIGAIPVLAELVDSIQSDENNHASLIDGMRLARIPRAIYPHGAIPHDSRQRALIVTETIFGMDGDSVDVGALLEGLRPGDILLLDEAHALGVTGPQGAGLAREFADPRIVIVGTLSKALGSFGGFVAGPAPLIELLVNRARSFIFDTALPPAIALAARIALLLTRRGDDRRARLEENIRHLGVILRQAEPFDKLRVTTESPILSIVLGSEERALDVSAYLAKRHIYVPAIRPPTVRPGTSRLRVSVRANHTPDQIDMLAAELQRCAATS